MINVEMLIRLLPFVLVYGLVYIVKKKKGIEKLDDLYFYSVIIGLIASRLAYAVVNVGIFNYDWSKIYLINHFNLNVLGGLIIALVAVIILSKTYSIDRVEIFPLTYIIINTLFILIACAELYLITSSPFFLAMNTTSELLVTIALLVGYNVLSIIMKDKLTSVISFVLFLVIHIGLFIR